MTSTAELRPDAGTGDKPPRRWITVCGGLAQVESVAWRAWNRERELERERRRALSTARPKIPAAVRRAVLARDGLICQLCFHPVELADVHLDHIRAVADGGPTIVSNLRVTHSRCNLRRGRG